MKTTITIAPDVIRAHVKAISALHVYMAEVDRMPLTADNDPALNQSIVFAFSRALMYIAPWVDEFKIDPTNFYDNPTSLLQLEVTFNTPDGTTVNWPLLRRVFEEYISTRVMSELLPGGNLAYTYATRADQTLSDLTNMLSLPASGHPLRLARSY